MAIRHFPYKVAVSGSYQRQDIHEWCDKNIGEYGIMWGRMVMSNKPYRFRFKRDAVLFTLRWA